MRIVLYVNHGGQADLKWGVRVGGSPPVEKRFELFSCCWSSHHKLSTLDSFSDSNAGVWRTPTGVQHWSLYYNIYIYIYILRVRDT